MKVLIIAGGHGTRLWPISRRSRPKQLQAFLSDQSLLQETVSRAENLVGAEDIFIVVSDQFQLTEVKKQLPQIPGANILREPAGKNTLAAITYGTAELLRRGQAQEICLVLYADHAIANLSELQANFERGQKFLAVHPERLLVVGVKPTYAETGYGYIEVGPAIMPGVQEVVAFREKPNLATANQYFASGQYLWNAGLFQWKVQTFADRVKEFVPEFNKILTADSEEALEQAYENIPALAIDYAIFEKDKQLAVIPSSIDWRDIGHWRAVKKHRQLNSSENIIEGSHVGLDTTDCLIINRGDKTIVTIGLEDFIIIDSGDSLLICPADRAQDVKTITEKMAADEKTTAAL